MTYRRINIFAGPGAGKSTNAARLFANMKDKHLQDDFTLELIHEYVKTWAWEGKVPQQYDQFYIFAKQLRRETTFLQNGGNLLITDSPILLSAYYAKIHNAPLWEQILATVREIDYEFPPLNVFLKRGDRHYDPKGRFETEDQARERDDHILNLMMDEYDPEYNMVISTADTLFEDVNRLINERDMRMEGLLDG